MPVVPYRLHLLHDHKTLYQFFLACQQKSVEQNHPHIASISMVIEAVDPLATLQQVADVQQPHFYLENPFRGEAIAAFGLSGFGSLFLVHSLLDLLVKEKLDRMAEK